MKNVPLRGAMLATMLFVVAGIETRAQTTAAPAAVTLSTSGRFARGGEFTGQITINRFEARNNQIVAIGFVTGVLSRGGRTLGSAVVGEVTWPVAVRAGGQVFASGTARQFGRPVNIAWSPDTNGAAFRLRLAQAESCQVVDLALGPVNVDLLGVQIALSPAALNLSGVTGTALGDLVCQVSDLLGNVAGLVGVLNGILGLLTGLLGGLTGGLGGVVPPVP